MTAIRPPGASIFQADLNDSGNADNSSLTAMRSAWNVRVAGWIRPFRYTDGTADATMSASSPDVRIALRARDSIIAFAMRREYRSPPQPHKTVAIFSSSHSFTIRSAVSVAEFGWSAYVMSSGSSRKNENPLPWPDRTELS